MVREGDVGGAGFRCLYLLNGWDGEGGVLPGDGNVAVYCNIGDVGSWLGKESANRI